MHQQTALLAVAAFLKIGVHRHYARLQLLPILPRRRCIRRKLQIRITLPPIQKDRPDWIRKPACEPNTRLQKGVRPNTIEPQNPFARKTIVRR